MEAGTRVRPAERVEMGGVGIDRRAEMLGQGCGDVRAQRWRAWHGE